MNIFGKCTIHRPSCDSLLLQRDPGLLFWLFILVYCGFVTFLNSLFVILFWETLLPRTLSCQKQNQVITCDYIVPGLINRKTIKIQDVNKAILSQKATGESIVLTSSSFWVVLEQTSNNIQNIQTINHGLAGLNSGNNRWKLDMYASANVRYFIVFFLLPIGLLLFLIGLGIIVGQGSAILELDAKANTVSIIRLGRFRSRLSLFNQLNGADLQLAGYLGILSDKFGIYGGDSHYRRQNHRIVRLLFTNRHPFIFQQQRFATGGGQKLIVSINEFISEHNNSPGNC